jgi:hypothetical protein
MLKMHIPRGAVEIKMAAEGFDPKVLGQFGDAGDDGGAGGGGGGGGGGGMPAPPPAAAARAASPPPGKIPAKASGGRVNLLADIAKRRID